MATPGRVQVPELNLRPTLNPAPVVNVQPVAPVNRQGAGSNLMRIAESLSGLSSSFGQYAQTQKAQNTKQDSYLAGDLSSMSYDQLTEHFKQNPDLLQKEKVAMMYAGKYANIFGNDLMSGKLTEDWDGVEPLDQFLAKKQQDYITNLPDDPMIRAYFNENANPYVTNYMQGRTKIEAENRVTENVDLLKAHADNVVEQARAATGANESAPGVSKRLPLLIGTQAGRQPLQMKGVQGVVLDRWEQVQGAFGKQLPVVSGARDVATNTKAGGAKKSQHLEGNALDIDVSQLDFAERRRLLETASAMGFTGIGIYGDSVHLDMRKVKAVWGPSYHGDSIPKWAVMTATKHMGGDIKKMPYSVGSSTVAIGNIFSSIAETPQWKQFTPEQRTAFVYDYAASITPKTEDDLKLIEGLLTSRRSDGVPSVAESADYAVKVRALLDTRKDEFRTTNIDAQTPVRQQVADAINNGAGLAEIRRIREASGNLFDASFWQKAEEEMVVEERKIGAKTSARRTHNETVDKIRDDAKLKIGFGQGFASAQFPDQEVPDPNDPTKTTTYTGKQLKEDVKNEILNNIDVTAKDKNLPDAVKWGMIANVFGKANETISTWEDAFKATVTSFNPAQAAEGVSEQMVTNAKLYDYLKGSGNYLYLDAHLKGDNVKQFWSMYDSFRGQGQNEREALFSTYKVMNDPGALAQAAEEINFAKGSYYKNGTSFVESELEGNSPAGARVTDMATAIAATGRNPTEALEMSIKIFKDTHVYAKSSWIPKNLKGLPENFVDNVTAYVDDYIGSYGAKANPPITDNEDVIIAPDASGTRFYLFQKSTGLPLMGKAVKGGLSRSGVLSVSLQSLRDFDKLNNDKAAIAAENASSNTADAIAQAGGPNAPTKTVGGGRTAPREVKLTPQEIIDGKATATSKAVDHALGTDVPLPSDIRRRENQMNKMPIAERIAAARRRWGGMDNMTDDQVIQFLKDRGAIPK